MKAGSFTLIASAIALASVSLAAQQPPPIPPPQPPATNLPPAPAALSVPNPLAGLQPGPGDLYRSPDGSDRFQHGARYPAPPPPAPLFGPVFCCGYPYFPGAYYGYSDFTIADTYKAVMAETYYQRHHLPARGALVLESVPDAAQVFVDGNYVGTVGDLGSRSVDLVAGTHRIELRAPGYDTLTFSVMIQPNGIVRYRAAMAPASAKPPAPSAPPQAGAAAKNFYVIPNCYAGDKPPTAALPKGCDIKKLRTRSTNN